MKKLLFVVIIIYPFIILSQGADYYPDYNYKTLDANNISMNLNNVGDLEIKDYFTGATWNQIINYRSIIVYDQGIWVIGKINNFPHLGIVQWTSSYSPGPILNHQAAIRSSGFIKIQSL